MKRWELPLTSVCLAAACAAWVLQPQLGAWPLVIGALPFVVRLALTGRLARRTPLDVHVALFLVTAAISIAAAYDPYGARPVFPVPMGWRKLWGLVLAAMVFYGVATLDGDAERRWAVRALAGLGAVAGLWFVATHDWEGMPANWDALTRLGQSLQAPLPPLPGHRFNPNMAGGITAMCMPAGLTLALGRSPAGTGRWLRLGWRAYGLATAGCAGLGLLLSSSRGGWLGCATALALGGLWWAVSHGHSPRARLAAFAGVVLGGLLVLAVLAGFLLGPRLAASQALANRLNILEEASLLVRDYPFTGCGLGQFPFVHSTYALLIHVPILVHAHGLFTNIAVEQSLLGALALAAGFVWIAWRGLRALAETGGGPDPALSAGMLALVAVAVHGLADDPLYSSRGLLLLWLPAGLIVSGLPRTSLRRHVAPAARWAIGGAVVALLGAAIAVGYRPLAAAWFANLGAIAQTQTELRAYDYQHFDNPTLDQIRQRSDLSAAEHYLGQALALEPGQPTARARLAQIALARGEYGEALAHMQAAWDAGHRDRITRLLYGDALAAAGRTDEAAEVIRGLPWAVDRIDGQGFYRYWVGQDWQRAAYAWRTALRLDPANERIQGAAERAEAKIGSE